MNTQIRSLVAAVLCTGGVALAQTSPYVGDAQRAIKSMSEQEVAGLLNGAGAGFARAAELNGYLGPMHVLGLADQYLVLRGYTSGSAPEKTHAPSSGHAHPR